MKTILAAAQTIPVCGNIEENIKHHKQLIELAAKNEVQLIVFPELSLTGYEPDLAEKLAFTPGDSRIAPLQDLADKFQIIIIAGAPVRCETGLHIASFIIKPHQKVQLYTKQYLHSGEDEYFSPCFNHNPVISIDGENISSAICADIANPKHPEAASLIGSSIYMPGVLITKKGYKADAELLSNYAKKFSMTVIMANFSGESGGYESAGKSAIWSKKGDLIAQFDESNEGLVIATKEDEVWTGKTVKL